MEESTSGATHPEGDPVTPDLSDAGGAASHVGETDADTSYFEPLLEAWDPPWDLGHDLPGSPASPAGGHPLPPRPLVAPQPRRVAWWSALFAGLVGALGTVAALWSLGVLDDDVMVVTVTAPAPPSVVEVREIVTEVESGSTATAVARKVTGSIVAIEVGEESGGGFQPFASGSGVVISGKGLIVTNHHVVEDASSTQVVFQDGATYNARVVGSDESTDVAVLEVDAAGLQPIEFGETETLSIGEAAIAIGNPLGLAGGASLTVGVVSAFEREVNIGPGESLLGMLQTDAPITQGSSGGALVDSQGRLIGITTAIGVSSTGAEGIGFAIPVELVRRVAEEIAETGSVRHAFLGVQLQNHYEEREDGATVPGGALVADFPDNSAAEAAGLLVGDIITGLEGRPLGSREALISSLRRLHVGDRIQLEVRRDGEILTVDVELTAWPSNE